MQHFNIGVLGLGRMGSALCLGALQAGATLVGYDPKPSAIQKLQAQIDPVKRPRFTPISSLSDLANHPLDLIFLAVKPDKICPLAQTIPHTPSMLLVSIAAGVAVETIRKAAPHHRVVRVMSNTPALVAEGMSVVLADSKASPEDINRVTTSMAALGKVQTIADERLMHMVTALAGSGPAIVSLITEALADGGVLGGLSRELALELATQTIRGTTKLLQQSHPAILKDQVASPGGTTIAAIATLENRALRGALIQALADAAKRSQELGE